MAGCWTYEGFIPKTKFCTGMSKGLGNWGLQQSRGILPPSKSASVCREILGEQKGRGLWNFPCQLSR